MATTDEMAAILLDEGIDYIETHGWTQHMVRDRTGRVCAIGALGMVAATHTERYINGRPKDRRWGVAKERAIRLLQQEINDGRLPETGQWLVGQWNDQPGRIQDDVTTAMRHTAKRLRKGAT